MDQCYGLDMKCPLQTHILGAQLPVNEPSRGDRIVAALTPTDSSIIRVTVQWCHRGTVEMQKVRQLEEASQDSIPFKGTSCPRQSGGEQLCSSMPFFHCRLPHHRSRSRGPAYYGLKILTTMCSDRPFLLRDLSWGQEACLSPQMTPLPGKHRSLYMPHTLRRAVQAHYPRHKEDRFRRQHRPDRGFSVLLCLL